MEKTGKVCIGLFGTCDNIRWRDPFMTAFAEREIEFFNPMVEKWDPSLAAVEAEHLANDDIILFPVLAGSYGIGSLAEVGFGLLQSVAQGKPRSFVYLVDEDVTDELRASNPGLAKASARTRALVKAHLKELDMPNVHVVGTLQEMLETGLGLHKQHSNSP